MRRSILLLAVVASGCARTDEPWPSLARRPIEGPAPGRPAPTQAPPPPVATPAPVAIGDAAARLQTLDRELTDLEARFAGQRAATAAAVIAARGAATDSDAWSKAELEKTRLERIATQLDDLRDRLDTVAATLAAAAASVTEATALLAASTALTARADALASAYAVASR